MEVTIEKQPSKRRKLIKKILFFTTASLLVIALVAVIWGNQQLKKPLPVIEGTVQVSGLEEAVTVWRDANGVPHIEADNLHDLYFAQGYVTAQDRLFQMDLGRRQASGTLSEVIGEATVENDKYFRTFGLRRAAEATYEQLSEQAYFALSAYAAGVNAFIDEAKQNKSLPVEFRFMGYQPEQWTPVDSLTLGKFMAYDLGGNWHSQLFRHYLIQTFSEDEALDLFPSYPKEGPVILDLLRAHQFDFGESIASQFVPNPENGSNNWVLSGERTETGMPLLADDPHLGLATPSIWYETHLKSPEVNVTGVIFAGVPGIILGHNEHIAWGVTNVAPDVQQLYLERRNPDNPYQFEFMEQWEDATVITEKLYIKDQDEPETFEIVITRHGPIISEFAFQEEGNDTALSLRWTAHEPTQEIEAVLRYNQAKNLDEFKEALTYFQAPAQNFIFADKDGNIAYRANGWIPIRKQNEALLPAPGWNADYEWQGYIPWDELPTIVNPPNGFIATANNKVAGDDYPYHLAHSWAQPFRQQRIVDVLNSKEKFTVDDMKALQLDQKNLQAVDLLPYLLPVLKEGSPLRDIDKIAIELLENWNFIDAKDLAAPLIHHLWVTAFSDVLFEDRIDKEMLKHFREQRIVIDEIIRRGANGDESPWVKEKGGYEKVVVTSFQSAIDRATEMQGKNPERWAWGDFHQVKFNHPLAVISPLHLLFNPKPQPLGGSAVTVNAAFWNVNTGDVTTGAAWRGVMDLSDLSRSYHVVTPGQSGHVKSAWYDDQINDWVNGYFHETSINPEVYQANSKKLLLTP